VEIVLRRGVSRDFLAGVVWAILAMNGCMSPAEIMERLRELGIEVGRTRLHKILAENRERLWTTGYREPNRSPRHRVYCALEEV